MLLHYCKSWNQSNYSLNWKSSSVVQSILIYSLMMIKVIVVSVQEVSWWSWKMTALTVRTNLLSVSATAICLSYRCFYFSVFQLLRHLWKGKADLSADESNTRKQHFSRCSRKEPSQQLPSTTAVLQASPLCKDCLAVQFKNWSVICFCFLLFILIICQERVLCLSVDSFHFLYLTSPLL